MNDEGFREIQLNGKQLVFLFMAATVVLVVTFLFGIMVGRGAPGASPAVETASSEVGPDQVPAAAAESPSVPPPARSGASMASIDAPPAAENLTYPNRLLDDDPPDEKLRAAKAAPSPAKPAPPPAPAPVEPPPAQSQPAAAPSSQAPRAAAVAALDPSGPGFAVQVAISKDRREADSLAKELVAKGYPAFVMAPVKGAPAGIYRVRIGKYKTRKDAEEVAARLKTVEQFDPWIAR